MKKVLLVGDLRNSVSNYGAFANSEMLIREIKSRQDISLKIIDGRSFWNETPAQGWGASLEEYIIDERKTNERHQFNRLKKFIKKFPMVQRVLSVRRRRNKNIFVPPTFEQYEEYSKKVLEGCKLVYEKNLIDEADIVIINGEGNIVKGTDEEGYYRLGGLYVLYIAYLSKCICNKKTYVVNHTVDPSNRDIIEIIKNIYPCMDGVYLREKLSIKLLNQWGIYEVKMIPDSLFLYNKYKEHHNLPNCYVEWRNQNKKLICIGDSSGIENAYTKVKWDVLSFYTRLINKYDKEEYQISFIDGFDGNNTILNEVCKKNNVLQLNMSNCSYQELYEIFKDAEIYISGRWHTSILALQARCPILLWGADSHKTEALYDLIDYNYKFFDVNALPIHVDDIVYEAKKIMESNNSSIFEKVNQMTIAAQKISQIF